MWPSESDAPGYDEDTSLVPSSHFPSRLSLIALFMVPLGYAIKGLLFKVPLTRSSTEAHPSPTPLFVQAFEVRQLLDGFDPTRPDPEVEHPEARYIEFVLPLSTFTLLVSLLLWTTLARFDLLRGEFSPWSFSPTSLWLDKCCSMPIQGLEPPTIQQLTSC